MLKSWGSPLLRTKQGRLPIYWFTEIPKKIRPVTQSTQGELCPGQWCTKLCPDIHKWGHLKPSVLCPAVKLEEKLKPIKWFWPVDLSPWPVTLGDWEQKHSEEPPGNPGHTVNSYGKSSNDAHFKGKVHFYQAFHPKCLANWNKTQTHEIFRFLFMSILQQPPFC